MLRPAARLLPLSLTLMTLFAACSPTELGTVSAPSASPAGMAYSAGAGGPLNAQATAMPTSPPISAPSAVPTTAPTAPPTAEPTSAPTTAPTSAPSAMPSAAATGEPDISGADPSGEPEPVATGTPAPTALPEPIQSASVAPDQAHAGLITAGAWSDLEHWDFWRGLMQKPEWSKMLGYWGISPLQRLSVKLMSGERPVVDQAMVLRNGLGEVLARGRSNNRGQVDLFAGLFNAQPGPYRIETADGSVSLTQVEPTSRVHELQIDSAAPAPHAVDLMLMVDTTGSMGDELEYLKIELRNVLDRVSRDNTQLQVRASANFYRDSGDEYLVRDFPFSSDFSLVQSQLRAQSSAGGGDTPEAVTDALEHALDRHAWSEKARARLLFLVLDAPPHHDSQELARLRAVIARAAAAGIRIIPVASSGIDKETEFLMRMLAISTGGEYVFLTDDSGIGGGHIEPTIGEHEIEKLNDLMVRLVAKYTR